jgi:hypothetical protein
MSIIFSDNFSGYAPGTDPFGNWTDQGFGKGQVVNFATNAGGAFWGQSGHGYNIGDGPIQYGGLGTTAEVAASTVVWFGLGDRNLGIAHTILITTDTTNGQNIATVTIEPDETISVYVDNQPGINVPLVIGNAPTQNYHPNVWQMWQVTWQLSDIPVVTGTGTATHTTHYIGVTADVWMNGTAIIAGAFGTTGIIISTSGGPGAPLMNVYQLGHPNTIGGFAGYLAEVWATTTALGTATFPFAGTNPGGASRMTQGVMEVAKRNPGAEARFTQGSVEIIKAPPTREARMTQGVVEIIKRRGLGVGWRVYEV